MNKLWYKETFIDGIWYYENDETLIANRQYIQSYIDLYCPELFSVPEDINTENLQIFLEVILKCYQFYFFNMNELINLGEAMCTYFHRAYLNDYPDTFYPKFPSDDRRQIALNILSEIDSSQSILPEDVPFLIACLNVEEEKIAETHEVIEDYFHQFDLSKRFREDIPRFELLNIQRLEAIEKGQPLPIRPMGIKLDPCYKK